MPLIKKCSKEHKAGKVGYPRCWLCFHVFLLAMYFVIVSGIQFVAIPAEGVGSSFKNVSPARASVLIARVPNARDGSVCWQLGIDGEGAGVVRRWW